MRRHGKRLICTVALAVLLGCFTVAPAWAGWSKSSGLGQRDAFTALGFANDRVGWVVGADDPTNPVGGIVRKTTDGGVSWSLQDTGSLLDGNVACSIQVIDAQTVIVAAENNHILKTVNGGDTWTVASDTFDFNGWPLGLSFIDGSTGWLSTAGKGGNGQVFKTVDGGATWSNVSPVNETAVLKSVDFYDAHNGIVTGNCWDGTNNYVWRTTNGGTSWTKSVLPVAPGGTPGIANYMQGVVNLDATHAWVVGNFGSIFFSADNGVSWTRQQPFDVGYDLQGVDFVDAKVGWAVGTVAGSSSAILMTRNGGTTWTRQTATVSTSPEVSCTESFVAVDFVSANSGFVCGMYNTVLKATNGGELGAGDTTAPSTAAAWAPAGDGAVKVTLTTRDDADGSGMRGGLAKTEYKLDTASGDALSALLFSFLVDSGGGGFLSDSVWQPYDAASGIVARTPGATCVVFRSIDHAGNVEEAKSVSVRVDGG